MTLDLKKLKEALAARPTDCPYCKIHVPGSVQMACTNLEDSCEFQIWCNGCWAHGPSCSTLQGAIDGWNSVADRSEDGNLLDRILAHAFTCADAGDLALWVKELAKERYSG